MADKGIVNGKILKTNTVDIRDSLNQFVYTTDLTKPKDLVNVAALTFLNNFNIIDGTQLTHSQYTGGGYTSTMLQVYNVFKQKNGRKLEFRNIATKRHVGMDGDPIGEGVDVELYNDDIILSVNKGWLRKYLNTWIRENLELVVDGTDIKLMYDTYTTLGTVDICSIGDNCSTYSGSKGLGTLDG